MGLIFRSKKHRLYGMVATATIASPFLFWMIYFLDGLFHLKVFLHGAVWSEYTWTVIAACVSAVTSLFIVLAPQSEALFRSAAGVFLVCFLLVWLLAQSFSAPLIILFPSMCIALLIWVEAAMGSD